MRPTKLSRPASARNLLVRNLATSLILYERVQTTPTKARAAQAQTERLISVAKRWFAASNQGQKLALRRRLLAGTADRLAVLKLTEVLADRFADRHGGYTRRRRLAQRLGDGAEQVIVTLTERTDESAKESAPKTQLSSSKQEINGAQ